MSFGNRATAWIVTAVAAATVCYSVFRIPLQVTDSLIPMLDAQRTHSIVGAFASGATNAGYFRPLRAAQIQAVFNLSNGHYFAAFKGFQIATVLVVFALFVMVLRVDSSNRLASLLFALTVLMGVHTFRGTVWEAYPVNHSLEVVAFCLLALVLARSQPRRWNGAAAAAIFLSAALTVESGLLVWVVFVAAWVTGARGISRRAVVAVTGLTVAYLALRFLVLHTGAPALSERSSGFGLHVLGPDELQQRFGRFPYTLYAYNVLSSVMTVLFSEPRAGVWTLPVEFLQGRIAAGTIINLVSSFVTTALILWFVGSRRDAWRARTFDRDDQVVIVALAVIAANAVISYGYTKDEIMGPAGVFYALAAFVAVGAFVSHTRRYASAITLVLLVAAVGWVIRTAGLHYEMHLMSFYDRNEWVYVDDWLARQKSSPTTPEAEALVEQLRTDALQRMTINPYLLSPRLEQWFR